MVRKDAWDDFYFFEFTKARFMAQDVMYPGEGSMCAWEKTTVDLKPLFDCLKSDPNSSSKKKLTNETESALVKVDETLNDQLIRINNTKRWD